MFSLDVSIVVYYKIQAKYKALIFIIVFNFTYIMSIMN